MKVWFCGMSVLIYLFFAGCMNISDTIYENSKIGTDLQPKTSLASPYIILSHTEKKLGNQKGWQENYIISGRKLGFAQPLGCDETDLSSRFFQKSQESNYFLSGNRVYQYLQSVDGGEIFDKNRASFEYLAYFSNQERKTLEDFTREGYKVLEGCGGYTNIKNCEGIIILHKDGEEGSYILKQGEVPYYFYFDGGGAGDDCNFPYTFDNIEFFYNF